MEFCNIWYLCNTEYHVASLMQCRAGVGACPDTMDSSGTCTNDVSDVTGFVRDGQQCVAFTRPFTTSKRVCIYRSY